MVQGLVIVPVVLRSQTHGGRSLKQPIAWVIAALVMFMGLRYSWLTWHGQIQPVLATWVIFAVAASLSWWTYWSSPRHSVSNNMGNASDLVIVWMILITIMVSRHSSRTSFNWFEIGCLTATGIILLFWRFSRRHTTSNLLLQVLMSVAYLPTLYQLWRATANTEPLVVWLGTWTASFLATVQAIRTKDRLALAYAGRALMFVTIVVLLIIRLDRR